MFLGSVTAMYHSFGGATTVALTWIGQGAILDGWGEGTPAGGTTAQDKITKPVISIVSEVSMHWKGCFDRTVEICSEARESGALAVSSWSWDQPVFPCPILQFSTSTGFLTS